MGAKAAKCCGRCFRGEIIEEEKTLRSPLLGSTTEEIVPEVWKGEKAPAIELETFEVAEEQQPAFTEYSSLVDDAYTQALSVISDTSLPLLADVDDIQVYGKTSDRGYFLKSVWRCEVPKERVIAFVRKYELRPTWDSNLAECRVVATGEGVRLTYHRLKQVFTVSPRDFVAATKGYENANALIEVATSVNYPAIPTVDKIIRAKIYFGVFCAESEAARTRITTATEIDFGGVIPKALMLKMSARFTPTYVKNMRAGLQKDCET